MSTTPPPTPAKQHPVTPTGKPAAAATGRRTGKRGRGPPIMEPAPPAQPPIVPEQDPAEQRWDIEPLPVSPLVCASLENSRESAVPVDPYEEMFFSLDLHEDEAFKDFALYDDDFGSIKKELQDKNTHIQPCDFPSEITALGTTAFGLEQYKEHQAIVSGLRRENTRMRHELQRGVDIWKDALKRACAALHITAELLQHYRGATSMRMAGEAEDQYLQSAEYRKAMSTCVALGDVPCIMNNMRPSKQQKKRC